ncbi:MAG: hypothetical protein P4N59_03310 [Negativicutes bacterium]|nr:hypothetical protein [Negativicutes bacterium]
MPNRKGYHPGNVPGNIPGSTWDNPIRLHERNRQDLPWAGKTEKLSRVNGAIPAVHCRKQQPPAIGNLAPKGR